MTESEERIRRYIQAYMDGKIVQYRDPEWHRNYLPVTSLVQLVWSVPGRQYRIKEVSDHGNETEQNPPRNHC